MTWHVIGAGVLDLGGGGMNASDRFVNEADRYLIRRVDGVGNGKPATLDEVRARTERTVLAPLLGYG